jgi:hypothetical protein
MFALEAKYWASVVDTIEPKSFLPLLDLGSATLQYRIKEEPWVNEFLFDKISQKGKVYHTDIDKGEGIDFSGDLTDEVFMEELKKMNIKSILCANILEHIEIDKRDNLCKAILNLIPSGGYIFVSCPYKYPYHSAPIDTMFRPTPEDLAKLFPDTQTLRTEIIKAGNYPHVLLGNKKHMLKVILRTLMPFYKPKNWFIVVNRWLFKTFETSCVVLQKN